MARCRASRFIHFPSFAARRRACSPSGSRGSAPPSRSCPRCDDFEPHVPAGGPRRDARRRRPSPTSAARSTARRIARWQFGGHAAREPEALRDLFARAGGRARRLAFHAHGAGDGPRRCRRLVPARVRLPGRLGGARGRAARRRSTSAARSVPRRSDDIEAIDRLRRGAVRPPGGDRRASPSSTAPPREEIRAEWARSGTTRLSCRSSPSGTGGSSALLGLYRRPEGDLRVPANNIDLAFAATRRRGPRQRRRARADRVRAELGARARIHAR